MFQIDPSWFEVELWLIIVVSICIITFIILAIIWGIRAHRRQVSAGREDLIGKTAEVKIALKPKGIIFIQGERWAAISEAGRVEPEEEVIVTKVDGLKLYVIKKE
ncbi:NfeD family protein [Chloroflexota bacterium]